MAAKRGAKSEEREVKTVRVRQIRSGIGCPREMRETLRALGLRRMHQVVERKDTPEVRGMVTKIAHLVETLSPEGEGDARSASGEGVAKR